MAGDYCPFFIIVVFPDENIKHKQANKEWTPNPTPSRFLKDTLEHSFSDCEIVCAVFFSDTGMDLNNTFTRLCNSHVYQDIRNFVEHYNS